jgi:formamidopyrimidine-DNA glycosylase
MPELPEVEVICRGIRPHLIGRRVAAVTGDGLPLRQPVPLEMMASELPGRKIVRVERRAKYLQVSLDSGAMLVIHLGMTGNLGIFSAGLPPRKHDHLHWLLDNSTELRYHDSRRFGSVQLLCPEETGQREETIFKTMGPEPFGRDFSANYLYRLARGRSLAVKPFIMTNQVVTGIGNIYANESLYAAGIHPARQAGSLSLGEWARLVKEIRRGLSEAIECGGSTISDFVDADRREGYFQINFQVYGRSGEICRRCRAPIESRRLGGRASYFCPGCQKELLSGTKG